jgi:DNA repair protein RecO (recombination protein O)
MLEIKDIGIIISSTPFQEKFLIVRCFSKNHGVIAGLIRVNKQKNDTIVGNIILFCWKAKLSGQLGYLTVEVIHATLPQIMFESSKVNILNSTIHMLRMILKEREINMATFVETYSLLHTLSSNDNADISYRAYIDFEAKLLNSCGYGLDWSKCVVTDSRENIKYISPKTGNAVTQEVGEKYKSKLFELPKFLIDNEVTACKEDIINALNILGHFIEQYLFTPYQLKLPKIRSLLIRSLEDCN